MTQKRYPEEFKIEAVRQVTQRGHSIAEVAGRLGINRFSLHTWMQDQKMPAGQKQEQVSQAEKLRRLKS